MARLRDRPLRPGQPLEFAVHRVPFFLEPDYPEDPAFEETNLERMHRKWGGKEAFEAQKQRHRLKERGWEVGIEAFDAQRTASNTVQSHRLVQWAAREHGLEMSEALYDQLNHAHFVDGRKLNDTAMLVECAEAAGLPGPDVAAFLASSEGRQEVLQMFAAVQAQQIHSIPTFIVDGRFVVQGAAHADELERVLRKVEAALAEGDELQGRPVFAAVHEPKLAQQAAV